MKGTLIVGAVLAYLLLLARSAWKQGELAQFVRALGIVAALLGFIALVVWGWIAVMGR